ncbi:bifunctional helix-turn-helix transcriptional regulator/GNAT family N-acetyltransferase [Actinomadura livida]|uniref:DNA-binding MarR family transcriptional regulator/GNAT superfamily N-acetyltransferase n=1 Tax=Actinomadura livida TaxID=79909 RepID=A0A7W7MY07_9ACTN|nr:MULTISPECIES: helix-turn-helix domain-containing GNAT family N-acetyltransferase [Actinomadura]MBB4774305.1 DNA-binding MarR family transcriptional regulator/GNAT superfamily N-acetyltransferase [Actinomadura catellatispora]GGT83529.1 MarR family transcriptional regulator [Actinomadura livida]
MAVAEGDVGTVRSFNRFYTGVIGVLGEGLVRTPYSLTEARVIFELAQRSETEVLALRRALDLDPGYLSRLLARFETDGLVERERAPGDARRQIARLTPRGREVFAMLDERSVAEIRGLLAGLSAGDRSRLLAAMRSIEDVLGGRPGGDGFVLRPLRPGDLGWMVERNGALYHLDCGWDRGYEALVASVVADYVRDHDPRRENAWIAESGGERVGGVFCVRRTDDVAQLRLLHVEPDARGMGIGAALVGECVRFAAGTGYSEIMLWTTALQRPAHRIYERAGFVLKEEEPPVERFGDVIHGQVWRKRL